MSSSDEMSVAAEEDDDDIKPITKLRVSFHLSPSIQHNRHQLELPTEPIAVPSNIRKRGLSAIVNHLLDRGEKDDDEEDSNSGSDDDNNEKLPAIPFDFLLNDKLLRLPLDSAARNMGLSTEHPLELYYFPARLPPRKDGVSEKLPDWIMAMDCYCGGGAAEKKYGGLLFTGGADGIIRTFEQEQQQSQKKKKEDKGSGEGGGELRSRCSISAHNGPIKCISTLIISKSNAFIATGSMDQTLVTHVYNSKKDELNLHAVYSGGHGNSISSVALAGDCGKQIMASGDWDGGLAIWNVPTGDDLRGGGDTGSKSAKKRKDNNSNSTTSNEGPVLEVQPIHSVKAHSSNISGLAWGFNEGSSSLPSTLLTGSWDHGLRVYDTSRMDCILALNGSRVVTSLSRCLNSDVVATGSPDCIVRLWDMRTNGDGSSGSQIADKSLRQR
jgi:ribosome biogenesis protein YTM1